MTDTNKILGQAVMVPDLFTPVYTVPSGTEAIGSSLFAVNTAGSDSTYSLYAIPSGVYVDSFNQRGADIDGEAAGDNSGRSVSLSSDGTVVAIGAENNDGNGASAGHTRVYVWNGSAWVQRGADIDGEAVTDLSGRSVSLSSDGTIVAIGAYLNDGNGSASGHTRVYAWNGSAWVQRGADIDGEAVGDGSGIAVSLSSDGTVVAIGAYGNDDNGASAGHTRVYVWNGSAWVQRGADIDGEAAGDQSGFSVSLSSDGTIVAIGGYRNNDNGTNSGHTRVYAWNGSAWVQRGADLDGQAASDYFGFSVSLSGDGTIVAIAGPYGDNNGFNSGYTSVYAWNGSAWVQRGADIYGEAAEDLSGLSVSLSSDGTVLAIGAPYNNDNGNHAGHTRVYVWNGSAWVQRGPDIDGEAVGDLSGRSVSLSGDGAVLAIGAYNNDGNGSISGHTRVYTLGSDPELYNKYAFIRNQTILGGDHHELKGGVVLGSGDKLWAVSGDEISVSFYGVEVS